MPVSVSSTSLTISIFLLSHRFQPCYNVLVLYLGNNILYVGMYGPKGPCEEVFIKHTGRNNYTVNYVVRDRGEYLLIIKWGDDHIPGSPFKIES